MKLKDHILIGGATSLGLSPVWGIKNSLLWLASSVIIDVDHYWHFIYHNGFKDYSMKKMFDYHTILFQWNHRQDFLGLNTLHTLEFILGICLLAAWSGLGLMWVILGGILFHFMLDLLHLYKHGALFARAHSLIEYWIRKKVMVRRGLSPTLVFQEALHLISRNK